eukprot:comp22237_c0_seq2/m.32800 comp22237_c0_seq2/g.32800  ORF comp22237_c0_seq2/g.32800 comp22237_c0_seq2/m.32800 type:complete len:294 (-) comp22237_c0_seq2:334-1215(-)
MFARGSILRAEKAMKEGDVKEAERQLVAAAEDTERRFGQKSLNMLFVLEKLARFYHDIGRFGDAETNYKRGLQVLLSLGYPQTNVGVISTSLSLADVYMDRGDLEKASVGYEWCLERAREAAKLGGENVSPVPDAEDEGDLVDLCLDRQAKLLARMGKGQQAVDAYRAVLQRAQQQVKRSSGAQLAQAEGKYAHMLNAMAVLCDHAQKYEEGLSFVKIAVAMCDGGRHAELLPSALYNQGCLQFHLGCDLEGAEQSLLAARAAAQAVGDGHQMDAVDRVLADLRQKMGREKSA